MKRMLLLLPGSVFILSAVCLTAKNLLSAFRNGSVQETTAPETSAMPYTEATVGPKETNPEIESRVENEAETEAAPQLVWPELDMSLFSVPSDDTPITDCGYSLDSSAYKATGGTAQGTMTISVAVPDGCQPLGNIKVAEPIVGTPTKYSYAELEDDITALLESYPDRFYAVSLGLTPDAREFYCLTIGNRDAKHHILLTAGIHAREYITCNLVMKQVEYLLYAAENRGCFDGKSISDWLENCCITVLPMCNPDGIMLSQEGMIALRDPALAELVLEAYRNDSGKPSADAVPDSWLVRWKANARGVNLNENFAALWGRIGDNGGKRSSSSYKGPTACSEPETQYMTALTDSQHYQAALHYHAMGNILYWDITNNKMREHSRELANNVSALTGYPKQISDDGGSYKDYCQLKEDACASVTIEIGSTQAPVDPAEMPSLWSRNYLIPFYAMKWAVEHGA